MSEIYPPSKKPQKLIFCYQTLTPSLILLIFNGDNNIFVKNDVIDINVFNVIILVFFVLWSSNLGKTRVI